MNGITALAFLMAITLCPRDRPLVRHVGMHVPPCIQQMVVKQATHIVGVNDAELGNDDDGQTYPDGMIVFTRDEDDTVHTLIHEFGHIVWAVSGEINDDGFRRAVEQDTAELTDRQRAELYYWLAPNEAWAELMADRYAPINYVNIGLLRRAKEIESAKLSALETCKNGDRLVDPPWDMP